MSATDTFDVIVIGGGPSGTSAATILAGYGHRVLVLEREKFPRYHVGESLIPFTYGPLERLGLIPQMRQSHFVKKFSVQFVAPNGGCDSIPDEVVEIKFVFLPPQHANSQNPIADLKTTLQLGMVFLTGPLSEIAQATEQLIDKAGRSELSPSFLKAIGAK